MRIARSCRRCSPRSRLRSRVRRRPLQPTLAFGRRPVKQLDVVFVADAQRGARRSALARSTISSRGFLRMDHRIDAHVNRMRRSPRRARCTRLRTRTPSARATVGATCTTHVAGDAVASLVADLAERLDRHRLRRHHAAQTGARRAASAQLRAEILADALARELEQSESARTIESSSACDRGASLSSSVLMTLLRTLPTTCR